MTTWTPVDEQDSTFLTFERGCFRLIVNRFGRPKARLLLDGGSWRTESGDDPNWDDAHLAQRAQAWADRMIDEGSPALTCARQRPGTDDP